MLIENKFLEEYGDDFRKIMIKQKEKV